VSRNPVRLSVVLLLAALYVAPLVVRFPLLDPDEGLHAAITQEMVARGDYVMPRFLGEPFLDKPILFFWAQAASFRLFGENEAAARVPGLVFGALGAISTGWLATTILGSGAGWAGALFYTTLLVPMALMQVPVHDIALVPFTNAALVAFWRASRAPLAGRCLAWSAAAGVALGFAILTKGLTGVAIVGLAHATVLLVERRLRWVTIAGGVVALAVGLAIALPWYLAMERTQPGYLHYYFVERHLFGFATETQRHGSRPWTYYIPVLLAGGLPWVLYIPFAWRRTRPTTLPLDSPAADASRLGWVWLFTGWAFLSLAGSKLFTYALPLFPAIALLAAVAWLTRGRAGSEGRWFHRAVWAQGVVSALLLPVVLVTAPRALGVAVPGWTWACAVIVAAGSAWAAMSWTRGDQVRSVALAPALGALIVVTLLTGVMPAVGEAMSARDLAIAVNRGGRLPPELWVVRQRIGSIVFYLAPALRAEATPQRVRQVQFADLRGRPAPAGTRVAIVERDVERLAPFLGVGARSELAGPYRLYRAEDLGVSIR